MNHNAITAFSSILGKRFSQRWIDRLALAHDASLYRLVPEAVVRPTSVHDVVSVLRIAHEHALHVTFRAAGTSLSGQAVTDGILIDISRGWDSVEVVDNGRKVKCGPGVTGGAVNAKLRPFGRKIGPDPASLQAAMIGGIVANNASGMCCGVRDNSYNTIDSICFLLPSGREYNTALDADRDRFQREEPELHDVLKEIRTEIHRRPELIDKITTKYRIKNTMGYTLISFLDYEDPLDILAHLLVGSEGTLGFVREVTFNTVADATTKYTQLLTYPTLEEACATVQGWTDAGAAAVEIMDDASIASYASLERTPEKYKNHTPGSAALLVEFHDQEPPTEEGWVTSERDRAQLWALRKGLMPTVGAARASGTTMINEDIAVSPEKLAALVRDVKGAFRDHGYHDAIIFGHAKDGNIHFVISQDFSQDGELDRYDRFMQEIARIVVDVHNGSLKAEHGTGRNMSPFLEQEWGKEATEIMWRIKRAD